MARASSSEATLRAADEEQQAHGAEHDEECRPVVAKLIVEEWHELKGPTPVGGGKLLPELGRKRPAILLRAGQVPARREACDRLHEMRRAHVLAHVPAEPLPDVDVARIVKPIRHHAEDGVGLAIERQPLADDRGIGVIARAPQSRADDRDRIRGKQMPVLREAGAELRRDAEDGKQIRTGFNGLHANRIEAGIHQVDIRTPPRRPRRRRHAARGSP